MPDPATREAIGAIIKSTCPLKKALKPKRPCPHFGASDSCEDCSYDWMTPAQEIIEFVKARRSAYESERKKFAELEKKHVEVEARYDGVCECLKEIGTLVINGLKERACDGTSPNVKDGEIFDGMQEDNSEGQDEDKGDE